MIGGLRLILGGTLVWTSLACAQRSDSGAAALIERARQKALDYARSLPDFVCTQVVKREAANSDGRSRGAWVPTDTLTVTLRYFQQVEDHKLVLINGKATDRKYMELAGATGTGEFGGVLRTIFDPASEAAFDWQSWKTVRKHRVAVYQYAVSAAHSPYSLRHQGHEALVGLHGAMEIDSETGEILHFNYAAYDIPPILDLQSAVSSVDYDFADVGGRSYLLPVRSETELHSSNVWTRNRMEFRDYRKFSADSVIDFGTGK
jgi:hypothetical protein